MHAIQYIGFNRPPLSGIEGLQSGELKINLMSFDFIRSQEERMTSRLTLFIGGSLCGTRPRALGRGAPMTLRPTDNHLFEPLLGIVLFEMRDESGAVHCMVSECALRNRAMVDGDDECHVDELFSRYRAQVEELASHQYVMGIRNPIVRALDLAPPPPVPKS